MHLTATDADAIEIVDQDAGRTWRVPRRTITSVDADVAERWMVNVRLHPRRVREIVPARFLAPQLVDGVAVLALCVIRMRHAGPTWAPLEWTPGSMNCALRVACVDRRDGTPCVWVDRRYTDSALAAALGPLGFPIVHHGLRGIWGEERLELASDDRAVRLLAGPGTAPRPHLFRDAAAFTGFIATGVRSYGPGTRPDRVAIVDLEKRSDNRFEHLAGWEGRLRTPWGDFDADGVYRTRDGLYRWTCCGEVDLDGGRA